MQKITFDINLMIFLTLIVIIAAFFDIRSGKIPNLLTLPTICLAISYHCFFHGIDGLLLSLTGLLLGIGILIIPFLMGGMGAGDAKLMGAVGAIIGPSGVLYTSLCAALIGGIYAVILLLIYRDYSRRLFKGLFQTLKCLLLTGHFVLVPGGEGENKPKLRYGFVIALGTFLYLPSRLSGQEWTYFLISK